MLIYKQSVSILISLTNLINSRVVFIHLSSIQANRGQDKHSCLKLEDSLSEWQALTSSSTLVGASPA